MLATAENSNDQIQDQCIFFLFYSITVIRVSELQEIANKFMQKQNRKNVQHNVLHQQRHAFASRSAINQCVISANH